MISSSDIQNAYNALYKELRKYIWDFSVVASLADLEIAVYKKFQNLSDTRSKFYRLRSQLADVVPTDEDLKGALDAFEDVLKDDNIYVKINKVEEVLQV